MANQPPGRTVQPPPDLPSMPDVSSELTNYLRAFSLWCRHGFADKLSVTQPMPGVMLLANDAATPPPGGANASVWMLQVRSNGSAILTPMPLGSGKP